MKFFRPADLRARLQALFTAGLDWPERRPVWLLAGGFALSLELFSYFFFQGFLKLRPCELCVYIRLSMAAICLGSLVTALQPRRRPLRLAGGLIIWWGLIRGLIWTVRLELIYRQGDAAPSFALCSPARPAFPFGLPLDEWLPAHFAPTAMCGEDDWGLFGLTMTEWLLPVYAFLFLAYAGLFAGRRLGRIFSSGPGRP